jgi:hypothetical protein
MRGGFKISELTAGSVALHWSAGEVRADKHMPTRGGLVFRSVCNFPKDSMIKAMLSKKNRIAIVGLALDLSLALPIKGATLMSLSRDLNQHQPLISLACLKMSTENSHGMCRLLTSSHARCHLQVTNPVMQRLSSTAFEKKKSLLVVMSRQQRYTLEPWNFC